MKLVFFNSQGKPRDKGLDLDWAKWDIQSHFKSMGRGDDVSFYNPAILKKMGFSYHVKERESGYVWANAGMSNIGNCAWRPLIMLLELEKMKNGDILAYRDINLKKHKGLSDFEHIDKRTDTFLELCGCDFFISIDPPRGPLCRHTKMNIMKELGENHPFTYHFPLLISNFIAVRKSPQSIYILEEWLKACETERWMDGMHYGLVQHPSFFFSTPEQAILSVIIANMVRKKELPINYPGVLLEQRHLSFPVLFKEKQCLYLDHISDTSCEKNEDYFCDKLIPDYHELVHKINEKRLSKTMKPGVFKRQIGERPDFFESICNVDVQHGRFTKSNVEKMSTYDHGYIAENKRHTDKVQELMFLCREIFWREYYRNNLGTPLQDCGFKGYGKIFDVVPNVPNSLGAGRRRPSKRAKESWWIDK
tara:strand:+ start:5042 stop:6301 length:1260 start_codon:yes stop_codon:yes gene_type:complete